MSTMTISTGSDDCYASAFGSLVTGSTALMLAGTSGITDADVRTWMSFVVPLPKSKIITSATVKWIATDGRTEPVSIAIYCGAADNASVPADQAALFAKSLSTAHNDYSLATYDIGVEYSYTVTTSVQEILNRAGWVYGNTMAILIVDNGTIDFRRREIAASENVTYAEPKLDIVFPAYIPRSSGVY